MACLTISDEALETIKVLRDYRRNVMETGETNSSLLIELIKSAPEYQAALEHQDYIKTLREQVQSAKKEKETQI